LVVVVSILSVLILLALAALVAGGIHQFSSRHSGVQAPAYSSAQVSAELPPGAKITSIQTSGNRVVVGVHTREGDEIDIFDTDTGRPVARIRPAPPDVPK
jgi:hypothetical protein